MADELVILLIFVNNKHFANTVTVGNCRMRTKCECIADPACAGI